MHRCNLAWPWQLLVATPFLTPDGFLVVLPNLPVAFGIRFCALQRSSKFSFWSAFCICIWFKPKGLEKHALCACHFQSGTSKWTGVASVGTSWSKCTPRLNFLTVIRSIRFMREWWMGSLAQLVASFSNGQMDMLITIRLFIFFKVSYHIWTKPCTLKISYGRSLVVSSRLDFTWLEFHCRDFTSEIQEYLTVRDPDFRVCDSSPWIENQMVAKTECSTALDEVWLYNYIICNPIMVYNLQTIWLIMVG